MSNINERQVALRSATSTHADLKDYLDRKEVELFPYTATQQVTVGAGNDFALINTTMITANQLISITAAHKGNLHIQTAALPGAVGTGSLNTVTDTYGNVLNLVDVKEGTSNDDLQDSNGRKIYGLFQSANTVPNGGTLAAAGAENCQISFVTIQADESFALTADAAGQTVAFQVPRGLIERNKADVRKVSGARERDVMAPANLAPREVEFEVTTAFDANEVITLGSGVGATAGITTRTVKQQPGDPVAQDITSIGASASDFENDSLITVDDNGVDADKGTEVIWDSATSFHFARPLDVGDRFRIRQSTSA